MSAHRPFESDPIHQEEAIMGKVLHELKEIAIGLLIGFVVVFLVGQLLFQATGVLITYDGLVRP